jgi:hypothetical protein
MTLYLWIFYLLHTNGKVYFKHLLNLITIPYSLNQNFIVYIKVLCWNTVTPVKIILTQEAKAPGVCILVQMLTCKMDR